MERFVANEDFYSPEFKSHYVKGLSYTIRTGNQKLFDIVHDKWIGEGKVSLFVSGIPQPGVARVSGVGVVKDTVAPPKVKHGKRFYKRFYERILSWL